MRGALFALLMLSATSVFGWPVVELEPVQDNTLYETAIDVGETQNERSNGAGDFLFTGRTGLDGGFKRRRALLRFDLSVLPEGATIIAATLTLHQSKAAPDSPPAATGLHRVLSPWGEGTSDGIGPEGQGDFATADDATWHHRLYPDVAWMTAGGDFLGTASATLTVGQELGPYTWVCTEGILADLALWREQPLVNFGWIVIGGEQGGQSAHRFGSREHPSAGERPKLTVVYRPASGVFIDSFETRPQCA